MKYISVLLFFLTSCNYYDPNFILNISGLTRGSLVISDDLEIREYELKNDEEITVTLKKGVLYSLTHYPDFYGKPSLFPSGAIITTPKSYITLSPHLGLLSKTVNDLHKNYYTVDKERVSDLSDKFLDESDIWRFKKSDCIDFLLDNIDLFHLKEYDTIIIPELMYLFTYPCENKLLREWYPGVFSFYDGKNNERITVEIYDSGEFCTLISR